jgi:hypothetical protein
VFQCGDWIDLLQIGLFSWLEETHVFFQRTPSILEATTSTTLFPCENWVSYWKEYFVQIRIFKVEKSSFCSTWKLFSFSEETHVSLEGKPSVLEAEASSTLFPCENWVSNWKEYFMHLRCFKVVINSVCSK